MSAIKHNTADLIWQSPGDKIQITTMNVRMAISELYQIRAEIKSPSPDQSFVDWLYADAKIVLKAGDELSDDRVFTGIVTELTQGRTLHGNLGKASKMSYLYEVEIRPKLWLLTRHFASKVFQRATIKEFISEILDVYGIQAVWKVDGPLMQRDYCIQYAETDYSFISRLLEEEGICFFFDMERDQVIFCDKKSGHPNCRPRPDARYVEEISPRMSFAKQEFVSDFRYREMLAPGKFAVHHYNYETSQVDLLERNAMNRSTEAAIPSNAEVYEHSINYPDRETGNRIAKIRTEEAAAAAKLGRGLSTCRSFEPGYVFEMRDHYRGDFNAKWLLTSCVMTIEQGRYRCDFTALPAQTPYRPPRKTPRPRVIGLQTAVVTGPEDAEVYLDDMGRCKIQFHWDREGPDSERSSMWVRVNNNYAGKDYGIQWIPRVGNEVVVTFIDGNPDLPIVTGRVYNDFQSAPLGPAEKYQNIIKTIKDNHILFDDTDNRELIDIRAQRNMHTHVLNDKSLNVDHDETVHIGHNADETVDVNKTVTVGKDYTEKTGQDKMVVVSRHRMTRIETGGDSLHLELGSRAVLISEGAHTTNVELDHATLVFKGDSLLDVQTGKIIQKTGASASLDAKTGRSVTVSQGNYQLNASADVSLHAEQKLSAIGNKEVTISGEKISITGTKEITIGVGASTIQIKPDGITLSAPKITSAAIGIHEVTGAVIKLN